MGKFHLPTRTRNLTTSKLKILSNLPCAQRGQKNLAHPTYVFAQYGGENRLAPKHHKSLIIFNIFLI
ncbi:MAG: hypothetical protein B7Y56_07445 [Gallionellales bacterium 35-53-114]|nr:MAG: hypothetical protein B7Y56_07445 [Gallionellales bacterium 35-53-114]OYZ64011.1 MAG: hypothetical protein B7Y04_08540 [Gallionellales bacterium 24-53-125]OZB09160.1 MAG: hypothetical protein B7X61_05670 [Gallionellales bacterium 39-52-133]